MKFFAGMIDNSKQLFGPKYVKKFRPGKKDIITFLYFLINFPYKNCQKSFFCVPPWLADFKGPLQQLKT
jgi:hypothetical protein